MGGAVYWLAYSGQPMIMQLWYEELCSWYYGLLYGYIFWSSDRASPTLYTVNKPFISTTYSTVHGCVRSRAHCSRRWCLRSILYSRNIMQLLLCRPHICKMCGRHGTVRHAQNATKHITNIKTRIQSTHEWTDGGLNGFSKVFSFTFLKVDIETGLNIEHVL